MPSEVSTLKVGDAAVRLHRAGRGPVVLFLHGAGGVPQWLPFFDALAERYELWVPEHPGFGGSDDLPRIRSMADLAMFYLDLIEEAGLDGVHLIGNSMGGWLAAEILIRDRSRFRSLVQLAPAGIRVRRVPPGDNFIWGPEEALRNLYHDQAFADRILSLTPNEEQLEVMLRNRFTVAKFGWQPRWYDPDLEKWLHRIRIPTNVVWGEHDGFIPRQHGAEFARRIPDAALKTIPDCGHVPFIEQPQALRRVLSDFIARAAS